MKFWKAVPLAMHVSWHEALGAASALPEGKRSLSQLRRLFAKARNRMTIDLCDLEWKLRLGFSRWYHDNIIEEGDHKQEIPLTFGRLLGMKGPDNPTDNVWQNYFLPLAAIRQIVPICELVNDILQLMHMGQRFLGYEVVRKAVDTQFECFKSHLQTDWYRGWLRTLKQDFPELFGKHPTDEMYALLGQEFGDWVWRQENEFWDDEI
ncbi:hypothetical protein J3F84DRAFT_375743 [Trichoderma pleuroticola]